MKNAFARGARSGLGRDLGGVTVCGRHLCLQGKPIRVRVLCLWAALFESGA